MSVVVELGGGCARFGYDAIGPAGQVEQAGHDGRNDAGMQSDGGAAGASGDDDAGTAPPDASIADAASDARIADPILGAWSGVVDDDSGVDYRVCIEITQVTQSGVVGGTLAATDSDDSACVGVWRRSELTYQSSSAPRHRFDKVLIDGQSDCAQRSAGSVEISVTGDGVRYEWTPGAGDSDNASVWARGTLAPIDRCP
jgi:hypothetical protein